MATGHVSAYTLYLRPFHKRLPIKNYFVGIEVSLTNLEF